jgi:hypothetical protein
MHVTAKIINQSGDNINMDRAAKDISSDINSAFSGEFESGGQTYTLVTDVQLEAVTSMDDVAESDHLFVLMDADGKSGRGVINMMGGKVMNLAASDYANDNWFSNIFSWNNTQTAVHEFGHAVGLYHESANTRQNLMKQGGNGTNVTGRQRLMMLNSQRAINKGTNSLSGKPYPYVHAINRKTGRMETNTAYRLLNFNSIYR